MMPLVSVIVPNFNHASFLRKRIESILEQTFSDFEVVLLDDASTDDSPDILSEYSEHEKVKHYISNQKNSGSPFVQWKKGLELAKGKFVWIAESDDLCDHEFLKHATDALANSGIGVFVSSFTRIDEVGNEISTLTYPESVQTGRSLIRSEFLTKNYIRNASTVLFRRELVAKVDWNTVLQNKYCGDWYFWLMLVGDTQVMTTRVNHCYFRKVSALREMKLRLALSEGLHCFKWIWDRHPDIATMRLVNSAREWRFRIRHSGLPVQELNSLKKKYVRLIPAHLRLLSLVFEQALRIRRAARSAITGG